MRTSWADYFTSIAVSVSLRSTCPRKAVGCVIVKNNDILATGYNGSVARTAHCVDEGCLIEHNHCIRTTHAEINAICRAAMNGVSIKDATAYVTAFPCWNCAKTLISCGIKEIVFLEAYRMDWKVWYLADETQVYLHSVYEL